MTQNTPESTTPSPKAVPVWLLLTVGLTFGLGITCGAVAVNLLGRSQITLSTPSIISFVFTVALGAAAIILAGVTIVLSRSAEDALIRRSDEGIRLQNDAFTRTSVVLSKIRASTGVTEKRIEDIISGRTALIVGEALDKSLPRGETALKKEEEDRLKTSIADSLKEELLPLIRSRPDETEQLLDEMEARQTRAMDIIERWGEFRDAVVSEIAKSDDVTVISEGRGKGSAQTMEEFWDAVIDIKGDRLGIDTHTADQLTPAGSYADWLKTPGARNEFGKSLAARARADKITTIFFVWDEDVLTHSGMKELKKLIEGSLHDTKLVVLHGSPTEVVAGILSQTGDKGPDGGKAQATDAAARSAPRRRRKTKRR